jgi:hypothetical protein
MPPNNNGAENINGLYCKLTEHRKIPNLTTNVALFKSSVLGASNPSATAKRFVQAYRLVDSMEANADVLGSRYDCKGNDLPIGELKKDVIYMKQCVSPIEAMSLTDHRVAVSSIIGEIVKNFPLPSCWCHVITLAPLEGEDSERQLGNLNAESFVVLLATAIVLSMTISPHLALLVLHELRIHAEGNFAELEWEDLEFIPVESIATRPTEASLRFALGMVGVKMARQLYRQREDRKCFPDSKPVSSKVLLDSIETFARDQCKFRPTCGAGYLNLGWIAQQSVAKRGVHPLEGAAEMLTLTLMKHCLAIADADDDDFLRAGARIEAAMCMVLGADGIVGYKVLGDQNGQAQRDMRSDKSRSVQQLGNVAIAPLRVSGDTDEITFACVEYEKRRMSSGVPTTTQEPGEKLIIPRWEVLKLWNEAMSAYD